MRHSLLLAAALASVAALPLSAQQATRTTPPAAKEAPPISDNSFIVEEAYNQELGVVQHVSAFRRDRTGAWGYGFTQEWPFSSQRHQLSYTVPLVSGGGMQSGLGDVMLNYRYQALGMHEEPVLFAPRLSVILPTGDVATGRGAGGPGLQVNLPLSIEHTDVFVTHWNAGATMTRARVLSGVHGTTRGLNAAGSAIWLVAPTFNLMLEGAWERAEALDDLGVRESTDRFVLVPGVRGAINLSSGMQIVPGIGVPIGVGPSRGTRDLFLYLSVEHNFR
jgi:hypothetical protein